MALQQLGKQEQAHKWYDQGVAWAQSPRHLRQVRELYQEAAAVMGKPGPDK